MLLSQSRPVPHSDPWLLGRQTPLSAACFISSPFSSHHSSTRPSFRAIRVGRTHSYSYLSTSSKVTLGRRRRNLSLSLTALLRTSSPPLLYTKLTGAYRTYVKIDSEFFFFLVVVLYPKLRIWSSTFRYFPSASKLGFTPSWRHRPHLFLLFPTEWMELIKCCQQ